MHLTESGGLRYRSSGSGPAMVLLHGWCMSSSVWRFQGDHFSADRRVIAPDFIGHGDSSATDGDWSFEGFASDVIGLFDRLQIDNALLVGWSLGAQVAIQACPALSDRLRGMVLVTATPCFLSRPDFPCGLSEFELRGMEVKVRRNVTRAVTGFRQRMFATGEVTDEFQAQRIAAFLDKVPVPETDVALAGLTMLAEGDMRGRLAEIDVPTLIIGGGSDVICLPGASHYLAEHIRQSELEIYEGCGHAPFLSFPERFNSSIEKFARRLVGTHA